MRLPSVTSTLLAALAVSALGFAGYRAGRALMIEQIVHAQVTVTPYTAQIIGLDYSESPNGKFMFRRIQARTSVGALVQLENLPSFPTDGFARRVEFPDGRFVGLVDFLRMKASAKFTPEELARRRQMMLSPPADCRLRKDEQVLGFEEQLGERLVRVKTFPGPQYQMVTLRAPRFACVDLAWQTERRDATGAFVKLSEARLLALSTTEPDPQIFDQSVDYTEAAPSDINKAFAESKGIDCTACEETAKRQDAYYRARRP